MRNAGSQIARVGRVRGGSRVGEERLFRVANTALFHRFDTIICEPYIEADGAFSTDSDDYVYIAKPYLVRRTPFDGQTRDGVTYTYASNTERTGTEGAATEDQIIVPPYVIGDHIRAMYVSSTLVAEQEHWLDLNNDGRSFAKKDDS